MSVLQAVVSHSPLFSRHHLGRGNSGGNWALLMSGAALTVIAGIQAANPRLRWRFGRFAHLRPTPEIGPRAAAVRRNVGLVLAVAGLAVIGYAITRF